MFALYVTGTDTGIGKTLASSALLHALRAHGLRAAGMKPVASGSERIDGEWQVTKALMSRSARILMEGWIRIPGEVLHAK